MDMMKWLQDWYASNCNGDWEHSFGIKISTLDNPGWLVSIDLEETNLLSKPFTTRKIERDKNNWLRCKKENGLFEGCGGPQNLNDIIQVFKEWMES